MEDFNAKAQGKVIDIEFNFYGEYNINRSIERIAVTTLTREQVRSQILGRTLATEIHGRPFQMVIDAILLEKDKLHDRVVSFIINGHDEKRSYYVRRQYDRATIDLLRIKGQLMDLLFGELEESEKAVEI